MLEACILLLGLGMGHQQLPKQLLDERDSNTVEGSLFKHKKIKIKIKSKI